MRFSLTCIAFRPENFLHFSFAISPHCGFVAPDKKQDDRIVLRAARKEKWHVKWMLLHIKEGGFTRRGEKWEIEGCVCVRLAGEELGVIAGSSWVGVDSTFFPSPLFLSFLNKIWVDVRGMNSQVLFAFLLIPPFVSWGEQRCVCRLKRKAEEGNAGDFLFLRRRVRTRSFKFESARHFLSFLFLGTEWSGLQI